MSLLNPKATAQALSLLMQAFEVSQTNVINAQTTRTEEGRPYKAQQVSFEALPDPDSADARAMSMSLNIDSDLSPGEKVYDPFHPHADAQGFVEHSNVNLHEEASKQIRLKNHIKAVTSGYKVGEEIFNTIIK